ncbi:MAG: LysM peptidoglycan-binding domain-containing protein [Actinomycetia bacterium]|nr:LysM peptidoglycan-binding domain-containing protein [Actinomycetes bacterium]
MNRSPFARFLATVVWCTFISATTTSLWFAPVGPSPEELVSGFDLAHWTTTTGPLEMAATLLRYVALGAASWFTLLTITALVLGSLGARHAAARAAVRLPAMGRKALRPVAAATVATGLTLGSLVPVGAQEAVPTTTEPAPTATLTHLEDTGWPDYTYPSTIDQLEDLGIDLSDIESTPSGRTFLAVDTWTVQTGDNFWNIAERTAPADATLQQVAQHWLQIIETNRDALPQPGNPDLIYPGMPLNIPES